MRTRSCLVSAAVSTLLLCGAVGCGDDEPTTGSSPSTSSAAPGDTGPRTGETEGGGEGQGDGGAAPGGSAGLPDEVSEVRGTTVAELDEPIALIPRPGDDLVWVAERAGTVRRLEKTPTGPLTPVGDPVLDITDQTSTEAERGLLGIAFSVDGSVLYVSHTDPEGNSVVAAYDVEGDAVAAGSRRVLLSVEQPFPNHNGGHVVVTPDDTLWLGLGDGGSADDPDNRAQDPDTLLGKLVQVDTTGGEDHEVVASGLRNPWRFSFDPDGTAWIADVGQNAFEEINRINGDDLPGANFGWSGYEGTEPYLDGDGRRPADAVMPVHTYSHDDGNCSITGGFTAQDTPGLDGAYLFADYCAGRVHAVVADGDGYRATDLGIEVEAPISFGTDADGVAYVLSAAGPIVRIDPA